MLGLLIGAVLATFTAAADSPANPDRPPAQDIARVVSTLDPDTGTWSVTVSLRGEPAQGTTGALNAVLYPPADSCGTVPNDALAYLRGNDSPDATDVSGPVVAGGVHAANGGYSKEHVPGSATVTLAMKDSALVGLTPGCVSVILTNHGTLDEVDSVPFPGTTAAPPPPLPPLPPPAPALPADPTIAFGHVTTSKTGTVSIALKPFDRDVKGKLKITDTKGHTLGSKSFSAKLGKAVTVKLRVSAATRRTLSRGRSVKVKLAATIGTLTKRTNATLRRR